MRSNNVPILDVMICVGLANTKYIGRYALRIKRCKKLLKSNNKGKGHCESMAQFIACGY